MTKAELKLDWCSHEAAKYAVEHWHYSKRMPAGKIVKIGIWEDQKFIGVVLFSCGSNNRIGSPYGLKQIEVCELTRVALTKHLTPVSRMLAIAIKMLHTQSPGIKLIGSYADKDQGHEGIIYQAANWVYVEQIVNDSTMRMPSGRVVHSRSLVAKYGTTKNIGATWIKSQGKHKYLYPLTPEIQSF